MLVRFQHRADIGENMSSKNEEKKFLARAYQHVAHGGISFGISCTDWTEEHPGGSRVRRGLELSIRMSNFGVGTDFVVPLTDASVHALRAALDIAAQDGNGTNQFGYLSNEMNQVELVIGDDEQTTTLHFDRHGLCDEPKTGSGEQCSAGSDNAQ
jgi:hypothetical protein